MAKSSFNTENFLNRLARDRDKTDIFTGGVNDHNIPSNIAQEEYNNEMLNAQNTKMAEISALPSQARETNAVMPGGDLANSENYRPAPVPAPVSVAPAPVPPNVGALQQANRAEVPDSGGGALPPPVNPNAYTQEDIFAANPQDMTVEGQQAQIGNEADAKAEAKAQAILATMPEPENPTGNYVEDKMRSLGEIFKEQMTKVERAQFNQLSDSESREVRLRFFLSLMEHGGKKGSSFPSNVGAAGRDALDQKRIITNQNNTNEQKRFAMDSKRVFDEMKFEASDRMNDRMTKRWEAALERVKAGYLKVVENKDGNMEIIDASEPDKPGKPVTDAQGRPVPADKSKAGGTEPKEFTILRQMLSPEDFNDRGKFTAAYDKWFGKKSTTGKDHTVIPTETMFKAINTASEATDYGDAPNPEAVGEMMRKRANLARELSRGEDSQATQGATGGGNTAHSEWYMSLSPEGQKRSREIQEAYEDELTRRKIPKLDGLPKSRQEKIKAEIAAIKAPFTEELKRLK